MFYRSIAELATKLHLSQEEIDRLEPIAEKYPMKIPAYYLSLINPDDPNDPIRKMAVPSFFEEQKDGSFDTSGEQDNTVLPGLQHKYPQTALILATSRCAMYCRHCFRKRLVGSDDGDEIAVDIDAIAHYIRTHEEITNVLITGGDSLMISSAMLRRYLEALTPIPHLDFIRLGTRIPVVYPQHFKEHPQMVETLKKYGAKKQLCIVTQFNHPNEITKQSIEAIQTLQNAGLIVKNQSVLLRDVNDDPGTLGTLLRRLTAIGCLPYYVFQCRPVKGVIGTFQVPLFEALQIVNAAKAGQNGFGKHFTFCLSHPTGKIALLGKTDNDEMITVYHEAKDANDYGNIVIRKTTPDQCWYD